MIQVLCFGDTVAEQDQRVFGLELQSGGFEIGFGDEADGERAFGVEFGDLALAQQERRRMACLDVFEHAVAADDADEHGGVAADFVVAAEKFVDVVEDRDGIGAHREARQRALQHGGEQSRTQAFAADVGDEEGGAVLVDREHVEVVASDFSAGMMHAGDGEMGEVVEAVRNKRLLDGARDGKLLLKALALALLLNQAGVVENAGGLAAEGVENLAVDGGEAGDAARIEIDDAEQRAVLEVAAGIGNGAGGSVERDGDHGAQTLHDDALGGLEIHAGKVQVFSDDAGLLADGLIDGGLAGVDGRRREIVALVSAGEMNAHDAGGIGLDQQAAIGVGDGDGVVEHGAEHGIERKLGVQQRGGFKKQVELAQSAGG